MAACMCHRQDVISESMVYHDHITVMSCITKKLDGMRHRDSLQPASCKSQYGAILNHSRMCSPDLLVISCMQ